ncbi:glycerophosphodiester phosphodiesterase [Bifidobacterium animalis subsp. animalis MCC 1489]|uniref:Phosphodiesterase n=1 Tax=Bifidobacterium animalis subsp. animalis IM386 TaxID=1402194 RepID=A0AAV2W275_9BIFI|nr:glycerophosphodiester phosphodiesterase family protein [Bifidobacterium animalis]AFI62434.1 phosphodiesterase [Bifidobacterium animalis subsp. animalis ATCC 25527]ANU43497.1 glycerophosphodiester phosphodiesterase [Bifidobacterium animalis subsp. animalis]AYN23071.1 phosphodiesterase [Bifidobacterium animalis subsp. animalis]KFI41566.1 glycerophosphoryl diester phosphodiesterase [Bifidobacterium animalis subsp. animalis]KOA60225.1 glycerophosphodiester phosphodiesterase [Bifidobacterium ani
MANALKKALIGGAVAAGLGVWAVAPRTFNNKRKNYVPTLPDVLYAHRGLHDAGSGLSQQHAGESGEYIALARRMALRAGYGSIDEPGPLAPENSLAAFAAAAEAGYGIELDVQLTLDNKVVVAHDPDLLRVAGDPRNIRDLTYDELVRIPLFPTAAPGAEVSPLLPGATENPPLVTTPSQAQAGYYQHVPLLEDVLRVVDGRVPIIVEFKFENYRTWDDRDEELMQTAADLLDAYQGLYVVESFNPAAMNWYKREHPDVCRGQLAEDTAFTANPMLWMGGKLMFNEISRPDFVAYDFKNGDGAMLRFVRRMGAMAVAWTVRTSDELAGAQPYFDRFIFEAFVPKQ